MLIELKKWSLGLFLWLYNISHFLKALRVQVYANALIGVFYSYNKTKMHEKLWLPAAAGYFRSQLEFMADRVMNFSGSTGLQICAWIIQCWNACINPNRNTEVLDKYHHNFTLIFHLTLCPNKACDLTLYCININTVLKCMLWCALFCCHHFRSTYWICAISLFVFLMIASPALGQLWLPRWQYICGNVGFASDERKKLNSDEMVKPGSGLWYGYVITLT